MTYLSFQQTYRLLIFEHCLGGNYLFIYLLWCPRYFLSKGKGGKKGGFVPSIREIWCSFFSPQLFPSKLLFKKKNSYYVPFLNFKSHFCFKRKLTGKFPLKGTASLVAFKETTFVLIAICVCLCALVPAAAAELKCCQRAELLCVIPAPRRSRKYQQLH